MPGLRLFNRRWSIGDDDFVFGGIIEIIFRAAWLITLAVVYAIYHATFTCKKGIYLEIFYVGLIGLTALNMLLTLYIVVLSSRGTIADSYPRRWLRTSLYIKIVFGFVTELAMLVAGAYWAFGDTATCDEEVVLTMRVAVVVGLLVILLWLMGVAWFFDPMGGAKKEDLRELRLDIWTQRCSTLCCCIEREDNTKANLTAVAKVTSDFFKGLDIVLSDIAAGLVLVQEDQDRQNLDEGYDLSPSDVVVEGTDGPEAASDPPSAPVEDWLDINRMIRYLKFAQASFGWPLYLILNDCSGPCNLAKRYRCCECCGGEHNEKILKDNCCQCNLAAVTMTAEIPESDIIYATWHNKTYESPFFVAYDHEDKTVVVSMRGLMSLMDIVTSLTMETEKIEFSELPGEEHHAHTGMMETAKYVKSELDRLKLLENAFQEHPEYSLVVTGYSLGAGLAPCLALLLHPQYPSLKAYAFAGPPVLSPALARHVQSFVCSVVLAKDMVPRLSRLNMERLKLNVLRQIKYSKRPKYKILASGVWHILCGCPKATNDMPDSELEERPVDRNQEGASEENLAEEFEESWVEKAIEDCQKDMGKHQILNVPGKIMRIIEVENDEYRYLLWTNTEELRDLIVTPKMLAHHFPTVMLKAFKFLVKTKQTPLDHLPTEHIQNY